jgi:hypothetical protein
MGGTNARARVDRASRSRFTTARALATRADARIASTRASRFDARQRGAVRASRRRSRRAPRVRLSIIRTYY